MHIFDEQRSSRASIWTAIRPESWGPGYFVRAAGIVSLGVAVGCGGGVVDVLEGSESDENPAKATMYRSAGTKDDEAEEERKEWTGPPTVIGVTHKGREEEKEGRDPSQAMDVSLVQRFRELVAAKGSDYVLKRDSLLADPRFDVDAVMQQLEAGKLTWQERLTASMLRVGATAEGRALREKVHQYMRGDLNEVKNDWPSARWEGWTADFRGQELAKLGPSALPLVIECLWKTKAYAPAEQREYHVRIMGLLNGLQRLATEEATRGDIEGRDVVSLELELFEPGQDPYVRYAVLTTLGIVHDLVPLSDDIIPQVAESLHTVLFAKDDESQKMHLKVVGAMTMLRFTPGVRAQIFQDMLAVITGTQFSIDVRNECAVYIKGEVLAQTISELNKCVNVLLEEVRRDETVTPLLDAVTTRLQILVKESKT